MWTIFKIIGEIVAFFGFLYGLCIAKVISLETAITIGIISIFFILCYQEQQISIGKSLNKVINPIKLAIVEIQTLFREMGKTIQYSLTETSGSPLRPTEFGQKLVKESGLEEILEREKTTFLKMLDEKLKEKVPFTAYDVQGEAITIMLAQKDNEVINPVKDYAFKNALEIEIILRIGGLLLRDKYLKEHPEITQ